MSTAPARLASLDAFRGFAIASMVLVNNPGDWNHLHPPLAHAEWHGWTFTDLVFPFFLFIAGVSMAISVARRRASGEGPGEILRELVRRAAVLFAVGLFLNLVPSFDFSTVRIPGVLQRIALCVLVAAPLVAFGSRRAVAAGALACLAAYSVPMLLVAVPDAQGVVAAGRLEPGRDFGSWVDRAVFGGHLWSRSRTWDPEGLVSTLPAVASLLAGVLAGEWLRTARAPAAHAAGLLIAGLVALGAGAALGEAFMPLNKNLWTPSYAVFMTGASLVAFAGFHAALDAAPWAAFRDAARRACLPLTAFGLNALFLFAFSGFLARLMGAFKVTGSGGAPVSLKAWLYAPVQSLPVSPENASLLYAIAFDLAMLALAAFLWKRRWFIKA